jgi:hypothetical protein
MPRRRGDDGGARAMGLTVFGDDRYRMTNVTGVYVPEGVDGEACRRMREDFEIEIGTAFGPLAASLAHRRDGLQRHEAQGAITLARWKPCCAQGLPAAARRGACRAGRVGSGMSARSVGYGATPPQAPLAGRRESGGELRDQLRGRRGKQRSQRR